MRSTPPGHFRRDDSEDARRAPALWISHIANRAILMPSSMVDSLNPYGNTLAIAIAGNEALKSNGALKVAELPRPAAAA